jgi:serine/threonine protein kinase
LHTHRVAHRDLKPDNILFRFPSNVSHDHVVLDLTMVGVAMVIADFGEAYDFVGARATDMLMRYPVGMSRGGAFDCLAPEIRTTQPGDDVKLNYDRADIWSLGKILIGDLLPRTSGVTDEVRTLINGCYDIEPSKRLSCYETLTRVTQLLATVTRTVRVDDMSYDEALWKRVIDQGNQLSSPLSQSATPARFRTVLLDQQLVHKSTLPSLSSLPRCYCVPRSPMPPLTSLPITDEKVGNGIATDVRLIKSLGQGAYAVVYDGTCVFNNVVTRVAVKYMIAKGAPTSISTGAALVILFFGLTYISSLSFFISLE